MKDKLTAIGASMVDFLSTIKDRLSDAFSSLQMLVSGGYAGDRPVWLLGGALVFYVFVFFLLLMTVYAWIVSGSTLEKIEAYEAREVALRIPLRTDILVSPMGPETIVDSSTGMFGEGPIPDYELQARQGPDSLVKAPIEGLVEQVEMIGDLPRIGDDDTPPWMAYARPFEGPEGVPLVAIVVTDVDLSPLVLERAITKLPREVSFAFLSHTDDLQNRIDVARAAGHEVILQVPMEPRFFPDNDPGPGALLSGLPVAQNRERLLRGMSHAQGYFAVGNFMGSEFIRHSDQMRAVMTVLRERGLAWVSSTAEGNDVAMEAAQRFAVPRVAAGGYLDENEAVEAIDDQLEALERRARANGRAVAFASSYEVTFDRINNWARDLEQRGLILAPASAVLQLGGQSQ